jgi:hypothetical protein
VAIVQVNRGFGEEYALAILIQGFLGPCERLLKAVSSCDKEIKLLVLQSDTADRCNPTNGLRWTAEGLEWGQHVTLARVKGAGFC